IAVLTFSSTGEECLGIFRIVEVLMLMGRRPGDAGRRPFLSCCLVGEFWLGQNPADHVERRLKDGPVVTVGPPVGAKLDQRQLIGSLAMDVGFAEIADGLPPTEGRGAEHISLVLRLQWNVEAKGPRIARAIVLVAFP